MKRLLNLFFIGIFVIPLLLFVFRIATDPGDQFELVEYDIETVGEGSYVVRGIAENNLDRPYENAQIGVSLLDAEKRLITTAEIEAVFVDSRAAWDFVVPVSATGATHYRIERLNWNDGEQEHSSGPYKAKRIE